MTNTVNPLTVLDIRTLVGFKQITPGEITGEPVEALKRCGITAFRDIVPGKSVIRTGSMMVQGNTFYGLQAQTEKNMSAATFTLELLPRMLDLKARAIQVGFRMSQKPVVLSQVNTTMLSIPRNGTAPTRVNSVRTATEETSAYYELVISTDSQEVNATVQVYVSRQPVENLTLTMAGSHGEYPFALTVGSVFNPVKEDGFSFMVGDIYIAQLDYNSDHTVTPHLLGNLTLEPFKVASYEGDRHSNTHGEDIVTALNTLDPNNDMGVLAVKPVAQPASVTFELPDSTGKAILGVALNVVYRDSIAPENRLRYQITEGTTQLPVETITERRADVTGFTTFSKFMASPVDGGEWNAENLAFSMNLFNSPGEGR
ncbi:hypothetical protein [Salmonella bongori]|uniref:Uncharacterized protein n=1 Tax=Salmonella bongori TaxID=54736 RepID=A0A8F8AXW8_SALBN|nr:hypothetical protein [Salmonella bongori]EGE4653788.1 hypothetical protein [Salmonella bongori serovar 40:z35:- str. 95-0123]QVP39268.1 hypothetical protein AIT23_10020 [Salmonella bongori serovar 40:z35:-]QXY85697.1 hypothetical protein EWI73_18060 [Salmonella bongori]